LQGKEGVGGGGTDDRNGGMRTGGEGGGQKLVGARQEKIEKRPEEMGTGGPRGPGPRKTNLALGEQGSFNSLYGGEEKTGVAGVKHRRVRGVAGKKN